MYTDRDLAHQFNAAFNSEYGLENYINYYLGQYYGNPFGSKSIKREDMFELLKKYESDIKKGSRKKLYEQMKAKGYSPEELADMLDIGVLESVVTVTLGLNEELLEIRKKNGQLEVIGMKDIHGIPGQADREEPLYSASSIFRLWDHD